MPFLRAAVTTVVAALLLLALVGWGHLMPWHRERPQSMDGGDIDVQEGSIATPPAGSEAGPGRDEESSGPRLPLPRVTWNPPEAEGKGARDDEAEVDDEEEDEKEDEEHGPKPKRGKGWGRGWT